jgi:hypothetical protein
MQTVEYSIDELDFREGHFSDLPDFATKWMSINEFLRIPTISINRDTERRKKRIGKMLSIKSFIQHLCVIIAEYPDGTKEIINGNTRKTCWIEELSPKPDYVFAIIIKYNRKKDAKDEYFTIDSKDSVEGSNDKFTGAYRELNLEFQSSKIKNGSLTNIMKDIMFIWPDDNIPKTPTKNNSFYYDTVSLFSQELKKIDEILHENRGSIFKKANDRANLKAVSLLFLKKYGIDNQRLIEGIVKLYTGEFNRTQNKYVDGISHICIELMDSENSRWIPTSTRTGKTPQYDYLIHCFKKWMDNRTIHHPRTYREVNSPYLTFFEEN